MFHNLVGHGPGSEHDGAFAIELEDLTHTKQSYEPNTAILTTILHGPSGSVEITDFAPRFESHAQMFSPPMTARRIRALAGWPRIRIRLRPRFDWAESAPQITRGSDHVRFVGPDLTMRLTTDAPVDHILDECVFNLGGACHFMLGPDESAETWHWYAGSPLSLTLSPDGHDAEAHILGPEILAGQQPQRMVPPHWWQCATSLGGWTLCGCTVSPGFDFAGFEMAPPDWRPVPRG